MYVFFNQRYRKRIIFFVKGLLSLIIYIFTIDVIMAVSEEAGIYVSSNKRWEKTDLRKAIEENVRQEVMQSYLHIVGEVMTRAMKKSDINVFPQIAYYAIQEAAYQGLKYASVEDILREAYNQCMDYAMDKISEGETGTLMQKELNSMMDRVIRPIVYQPVFQRIVEKAIEQAVLQHRAVVVQQIAQRQARLAVIQQRYMAMQQAMAQLYEKAIIASILNHKN